ncbi:MAG: CCA tRNA nucleotidyltransferase [Clostridia bacterium]|nr:CCA tRNA nucleotidyltransferase [Clostridia bacterium]
MNWIHTIAQVLPGPVYLVGGAVRNTLMGLPIADYDMCGPLQPQEIMAACEGTAVRAVLRAAHFGTVELHLRDEEGRHMAEYTTFRIDSYRGGHSPSEVRFAEDIPTDALRRDFSVNALYQQILPNGLGEVIDPAGGLEDLKNRRLHTVTTDPLQVMKDDGLRLLRLVRFACEFGLTPSRDLIACAREQAGLLREIVPERLKDEVQKILLSDVRYPQLSRETPPVQMGLALLDELGFFPYLLPGLPLSLKACASYRPQRLCGRLAALLKDADPLGAQEALAALKCSAQVIEDTATLIRLWQGYPHWTAPLWDACQARENGVAHLIACLEASGQPSDALREIWQTLITTRAPLSLKELAVNGRDLAALGLQGPAIGQTLQRLWREAVLHPSMNEREKLLKLI